MSSSPRPAVYVPEPYDPRRAVAPGADAGLDGLTAYVEAVVLPELRRKRRFRMTVLVLVLLLAGLGAGWQLVWRNGTASSATAPAGSGVAPGDPTDPPFGLGSVYRSASGHFAARFLGLTAERSQSGTIGGESYTLHFTGDESSGAFVAGAELTPGVPRDQVQELLHGLIAGMGGRPGLTLGDVHATTFKHRPARSATLTNNRGTVLTLLAVVYGSQRIYLLGAPSGSALTLLKSSFVALP